MAVAHPPIKVCNQCKTHKNLNNFPPDRRRKDGRATKCKECVNENKKSYYSKYPEKERERRLKGNVATSIWYANNKEECVRKFKWNALKRKYGISQDQYNFLLKSQDNKCAVCRSTSPGRGDGHFSVDHDHNTGKVRGLLCQRCNCGIGFFRDETLLMKKAIEYVEQHREDQSSSLLRRC